MKYVVWVFLSLSFVSGAWADALLTFSKWKQEQILTAQNKVVRLSNNVHIQNSQKFVIQGESEAKNQGEIDKMRKDLQLAIDYLHFTKSLTREDYYVIYLKKFMSDETAMKSIARTFSEDEVASLLQAYLLRLHGVQNKLGNNVQNRSLQHSNRSLFKHILSN